jgi:hypothetical protein
MDPLVLIGLVVVLGGVAVWYFNRDSKSLDVNSDGKVDFSDAKVAVENTVAGVKETVKNAVDFNNDGKVDAADAKVVATKAKKAVKKTATKAKTAAKKVAPKLKVAK